MRSIRGQDYSVGMTLFWGRSGQKRRLFGACVALEEGAVHSVRTLSIRLECGPFGFCHFSIGFTADRFKSAICLIPIHFKADRFKTAICLKGQCHEIFCFWFLS
jgi:hypothetical protein